MMNERFPWAQAQGADLRRYNLITAKDGNTVGVTPLFAKTIYVMGRNADRSDIVLDHASISRQHVALVHSREDGQLFVVDLGSSHGTFLNGKQLAANEKYLFRPGTDVLTVGGSTRQYTLQEERPPQSTSVGAADGPGADEDEGLLPMPSQRARRGDDDDEGWITGASTSSSSSSSSAAARNGSAAQSMPPPPPRAPKIAAITLAPQSQGGQPSADAAADAAAAKAEARRKRDAEIAAAVASVMGTVPAPKPVAPPVAAGPHSSSSSSSSSNGAAADDYDEDDDAEDDDDAEAAEAAQAAAMGLPVAFGGAAASKKSGNVAEARKRRPDELEGAGTAKRARIEGHDDDNDDGDAEDDDADVNEVAERLGLPVSHEAVLGNSMSGSSSSSSSSSSAAAAVTALAIDPSGGRILAGCSADYTLRMYDFGGMDREHRPFREIVPEDGQPIVSIAYSHSGDRFLVGTGSARARVFDREGSKLCVTVKGDMYLSDVANAKGHAVGPVTGTVWHPSVEEVFITSSLDSSVRLWNMAAGKRLFDELCCSEVIKCKTAKGQRAGVTTLALQKKAAAASGGAGSSSSSSSYYSGTLAAGCDDGSLQIFNLRSSLAAKYTRPDVCVRDAHGSSNSSSGSESGGAAVTSITFSPDGTRLASRGQWDDCVKIWDVRKLGDRSKPIATISGLPTVHANANTAWSPDGSVLLAGCDVKRGSGKDGLVLAFQVSELEASNSTSSSSSAGAGGAASSGVDVDAYEAASYAVNACPGAASIVLHWHSRINQLLVGCGDGKARVLYSPSMSNKGALLSSARAAKRRDLQDAIRSSSSSAGYGRILLPNALPMYREGLDDKNLPLHIRPKLSKQERKAQADKWAAAAQASSSGVPAASQPPADEPEFLHTKKSTFTEFYVRNVMMGGQSAAAGAEGGAAAGAPRNLRAEDPAAVLRQYASAGKAVSGAVFASKTLEEELEDEKRQIDTFLHGNVTGGT